ncbi:MAG TPA: valine--tRNA ligase [Candidatus Polarisedimenticolia bacterium]|nr:valine--tRNA ligase [Candidatus Polarisedimenticolia bacterium]
MDKSFDPRAVEPRWRRAWEELGLYRADPASGRPPFSMVIPPPNITGRLHVGHGLNNTLQDVLARWKRMGGHDVLWVPGSDHASIATHVMLERQLEKEGTTRQALGREVFLERAWAWKEKYGGEIVEQLRRLGVSCDWSRERFTMDPGLSRAVREVFVRLYEEGLIYRDRYMINWCPRCRTAVSDLEVVHKEFPGTLWTLRYDLEGGGAVRVATTRPETFLGDAAVAVHPDDERHRGLAGRTAILPILGRRIPVVADDFVDPSFGTGAVKVTPAHDPNDFLAGRRLGLAPIVIMDDAGRMTAEAGPCAGLDRFECRRLLVERLRAEGVIEEEKPHTISAGRCQRCDTIVEPMISLQWFVAMEPLARPALEAVESGRIVFIPDSWRKTYFEWMRNIRDWCISRQLWWGHRIPAWSCAGCGRMLVLREDPSSCPECGSDRLEQDPDVLDTWFSSGLWAFSTLGWPDRTPELGRYYPTSVLVTGYDIIFFWVARMIMMGLKFMGDVPFRAVFYNGLVRDAQGEKISKMKGNVIDLFDLMDTYGTDAVRFTYAAMSSPGADVPLSPGRLEGSRAFANKIWNAARFARPHLEGPRAATMRRENLSVADRWILSRGSRTAREIHEALSAYRFDEAAAAIYRFTWHDVCDWYLELSKPALAAGGREAEAARAVLSHTLDRVLRLLHPFMPFLTEELWQGLVRGAEDPVSLSLAAYPQDEPRWDDPEAERMMDRMMETVVAARNLRAASGIAGGTRLPRLELVTADDQVRRDLSALAPSIAGSTRTAEVVFVASFAPGIDRARTVTSLGEIGLPLEGVMDRPAERERLQREIERVTKELSVHQAKLSNDRFVQRARPEAVEKVRSAHRELSERLSRLQATLAQIAT